MKTANGIEIADNTKTPVRKIVEYLEHSISVMESDTSGEFSIEEILSLKGDLDKFRPLLEEEKELITQAYEDGNRDGKDGEFNSGYFELNFES